MAVTYAELKKFNDKHDPKTGRFTFKNGTGSGMSSDNTSTAARLKAEYDKEASTYALLGLDTAPLDDKYELLTVLNPGTKVNIGAMPDELRKQTVDTVKRFVDKYPMAKDAISKINVGDSKKSTLDLEYDYFKENPTSMAFYNRKNGELCLNPAFYDKKSSRSKEFADVYKGTVERGFHPQGTDYNSVIVHEMAHAIDNYYSRTNNTDFSGDTVREVNFYMRKEKKDFSAEAQKSGLSTYATVNEKEFFAEAIAEYFCSPNPREIATRVGNVLDSRMDNDRHFKRTYKNLYDRADDVVKSYSELKKFNPYHDKLGRFASANGASSFTIASNKPFMDKALARAKEKEKNRTSGVKTSGKDTEGRKLTKEQEEYFKDSKVRDSEGNLIVMYHGTANGGAFTEFEGNKLGNQSRLSQIGQGFYFTNSKEEAKSYMSNVDVYGNVSGGKNPHLHEVYLDVKKPFTIGKDKLDVDKAKKVYMEGDYDWFFSNGLPHELANKQLKNGKKYSKQELQGMSKEEKVSLYVDENYMDGSTYGTKSVLQNMVKAYKHGNQDALLKSMGRNLGCDGIVEEVKTGMYQYSVFSSNQIKSVSNPNPTNDANINKAVSYERLKKFNPYHGRDGRFTFANGATSFTYKPGTKAGDKAIEREKARQAGNGWASKIEDERQKVLAMSKGDKGIYLHENDADTYENLVSAMRGGKLDDYVKDYFDIMKQNGDPTPAKSVDKQYYFPSDTKDWGDARLNKIQELTGVDRRTAIDIHTEMRTWTSSRWDSADTETIDSYIEKAPAFGGKIYRGMRFSTAEDYDAFMSGIEKGSELSLMNGRNSSWSSSEEVARRFGHAGDQEFNSVVITCAKNRTSVPIDYIAGNGEDEVVSHSKAKWTVLHYETEETRAGKRKAYITVVEKGDD